MLFLCYVSQQEALVSYDVRNSRQRGPGSRPTAAATLKHLFQFDLLYWVLSHQRF